MRPVLVHDARAALFHARGSVVASGTATVEAALAGNPFVVVYRLSKLSYAIARRFVSVPHVAMANLIAGRRVVPELIQNEFTAANVVRALTPLLADGPVREETMAGLREVRERLADAGCRRNGDCTRGAHLRGTAGGRGCRSIRQESIEEESIGQGRRHRAIEYKRGAGGIYSAGRHVPGMKLRTQTMTRLFYRCRALFSSC